MLTCFIAFSYDSDALIKTNPYEKRQKISVQKSIDIIYIDAYIKDEGGVFICKRYLTRTIII